MTPAQHAHSLIQKGIKRDVAILMAAHDANASAELVGDALRTYEDGTALCNQMADESRAAGDIYLPKSVFGEQTICDVALPQPAPKKGFNLALIAISSIIVFMTIYHVVMNSHGY